MKNHRKIAENPSNSMQKTAKKVRIFGEIFIRPNPLFCWFAGLMLMGGSGGGVFRPQPAELENSLSKRVNCRFD